MIKVFECRSGFFLVELIGTLGSCHLGSSYFDEQLNRVKATLGHVYPTRAEAEAAKARFEFRQEHPNMPEEWYERNGPGAKREFTPPDHVMFRGERLERECFGENYASWCNSRMRAVASQWQWYVGTGMRKLGGEDWSGSGSTSLADGFARLQAWLAKDAEEWEAKQRRACPGCGEPIDTRRPGEEWITVGPEEYHKRCLQIDEDGLQPKRETQPKHVGQARIDRALDAVATHVAETVFGVADDEPTRKEMDEELEREGCAECGKPFDAYRRPEKVELRGREVIACSNCVEVHVLTNERRRESVSPGPHVYDEPAYQPPRMNATAKWHNRHTAAADEKPGWE